jgi:hypothetical protein
MKAESVSNQKRGGDGGGAEPQRKTFSAIKEEHLGSSMSMNSRKPDQKGDYFSVRGTVVYYRNDFSKPPWYVALSLRALLCVAK